MSKTCTQCKEPKGLDSFGKNSASKDGLKSACRTCRAIEKKGYTLNNKDKISANSVAYYAKSNKRKQYHKEYMKTYRETNKKTLNEYSKTYKAKRNSIDESFKLAATLRKRLGHALNKKTKVGSAIRDLGCSVQFLKTYLESKFTNGMSWSNRGRYGWHVDHIKPLSKFNLKNPKEFEKAVHYSNLQPLWAAVNLKKGKKYEQS